MAAVSKPSQSSAQGRFAGTPNRIRRGRADYSGGELDQLGADGCGRRLGAERGGEGTSSASQVERHCGEHERGARRGGRVVGGGP